MLKGIFAGIIPFLENALDLRSLRHRIISSNLANEETPDYKAQDLDFQQVLKRQIESSEVGLVTTDKNHFSGPIISGVKGAVVKRDDSSGGANNNSVSLEKEMIKLAENTLMYEATVSILAKKFQTLKGAIKGG